ncbi:UNVERIFIED_CONTAM: hypothetical protein GTU68_052418 [Idotea baltica]|nr:hypothetical protein [Idotea baltica]
MKTRLVDSTQKFTKYGQVKSVTLHGALKIYVDKAVNLPNLDTSLLSFKNSDVSDPYIDIIVEDMYQEKWKVATTSVIDNNLNPVWNETFDINICHQVTSVKFIVKDKDVLSADVIGTVTIRAEDLVSASQISGDFELYVKGKPKKKSKITLAVLYNSLDKLTLSPEVPGCFFGMRELNNVTLYQDAHCVGLPPINDKYNNHYYQPRAWLDLYNAIMGAKEFIYIVGWSVNTKISLLRWDNEDNRCIGDILLQKASEGVQIVVMVWDELTSTDFNKEGTMGTSDQATADFFKNTDVTVILVPRERHSKDVSTKEKFTNFCYTHHQKCVVVDSDAKEFVNKRQTVAFVGGLDITNGRFDTPNHPLFETLNTDHENDFYNSLCISNQQCGPREPWHDIHCRIEGPATLDLLLNFKQRWQKQGSKKDRGSSLTSNESKLKHGIRKPDNWNVQVFRSINSDSVLINKSSEGFSVKKERIFDNSIQRAYIHNIRRSKHFLYIENQYFMGSSHEWLEHREAGIENLIPLEIAAHIERKIKANERFVAYILIPMFPEGKPADKVTQEMLHWQFRTMEMMYYRIGNAIRDVGINAHPQDYLLFFCLGKKEGRNPRPVPSELTGFAAKAFKHRRLMIYVHSKMAIFDDEYVIVGSANINDRSLNGNRDTEIAIGAFQPEYMSTSSLLADGDVSKFRKSLWLEHMGNNAPLTQNPSGLACAREVKKLAEEGFLSYINESDMVGIRHLLLYPLDVSGDGSLKSLSDCPNFPDTNASVIGKKSGYIPTALTI